MGNWVWFHCCNPACGHFRAMALAPLAIKLGLYVPLDPAGAPRSSVGYSPYPPREITLSRSGLQARGSVLP